MIDRKIASATTMMFLFCMLMIFNSCGKPLGTGNSPQGTEQNLTIAGNPMSDKVKYAICSVLVRCNSEVTIEDCEQGVDQSNGIGSKLGLLSGAYDQFSKLKAAESARQIVANPIAVNPCYGDINELMCGNPMVLGSYDSSSANPFANVANLIPTARFLHQLRMDSGSLAMGADHKILGAKF